MLPASIYEASMARTIPGDGRVYHADVRAVWRRFVAYKTYAPVRDEAGASAFLGSLAPNLPVMMGKRDIYGYDPVHLSAPDALDEALRRDGVRSPLLKAVGAGAIVTLDASGNAVAQTLPMSSRAQFWTGWRTAPGCREALAAVTRPDWDGTPLVVGALTRTGVAQPLLLAVRDETPEKVVVELPQRHEKGIVCLADTDYPGWTAEVDGKRTDILSANGVFRGVYVPDVARSVVFRYTPSGYRIGVFLSLISAGIFAGILTVASIQSVELARPQRDKTACEPAVPRREIG
jgi:hypothetical protein